MKKYSVLMSVYRKEKADYFQQSIQSILDQTKSPDEFVIVCDGELTEELDTVLARYTREFPEIIKVVRLEKNVGLGRALNEGIKKCRNSLIARMDSDDVAFPDRCEKQIEVMEKGYDIVSGTVLEFEGSIDNITAARKLPREDQEIRRFARRRNPFNHPCVMYRRETVEKAGGYRDFYLFEDYYLWARALLAGAKCYNIEEPILYMRAGTGMYERRGGIRYVRSMLRFRWYLHKAGLSSSADLCISAIGQTVVCLVPSELRKKIYEKLLRKQPG